MAGAINGGVTILARGPIFTRGSSPVCSSRGWMTSWISTASPHAKRASVSLPIATTICNASVIHYSKGEPTSDWPVGLSTGCFYQRSIFDCLEPIRAGGFRLIEICSAPAHLDYHARAAVRRAAERLAALGIGAYSFHAPFGRLREIGDRVALVPEAATILFQGGFPRSHEPHARCFARTAIFHVQRDLEDVQASLYPGRALLCDRGTIDGAAYWPGEVHDYFRAVGSTIDAELRRYDAVISFESAAVGGASIEGGNPMRNETVEEAVALDGKMRSLWSRHPRFVPVPHNPSFFKKISFGLTSMVPQLGRSAPDRNRRRGLPKKSVRKLRTRFIRRQK